MNFNLNIWRKSKNPLLRNIAVFSLPLIILLIILYFYVLALRYTSTDNAYVKVGKVSISSEVQGKVNNVFVRDNQYVSKGTILFSIDPEPFIFEVKSSQANLNQVINNINQLRAQYFQDEIKLKKTEKTALYNKAEYERAQKLVNEKTISPSTYDKISNDFEAAKHDMIIAQKQLDNDLALLNGDANINIEKHPLYLDAKSKLDLAELNLRRTKVLAPLDGILTHFTLKPGDSVMSGLPISTLVDPKDMWIEANFKETEITNVKPGQKVAITVDTYPDLKLKGIVESITPATGAEFSILPAQNSSGNWIKVVQRIMVKIIFTNYTGLPKLAAGMSTVITIDTKSLKH